MLRNLFENTNNTPNTIILPNERQSTFATIGSEVHNAVTVQQALDMGNLNYEVEKRPIFLADGTPIEGKYATTRISDNFVYDIVSNQYTIVQNKDAFDFINYMSEDIQFEKKFDVFTDDEVEARYLITPSFMERLNEMQVAFTADKVSCAFYKKYLFIALHTSKDLFSICSLFKKIDEPKQFFTMFEEILSIIKLIDHFKLNQKIGL